MSTGVVHQAVDARRRQHLVIGAQRRPERRQVLDRRRGDGRGRAHQIGGGDVAQAVDDEAVCGGARRRSAAVVVVVGPGGAIESGGERRRVGAMIACDRPRRRRRAAVHDGAPEQSTPCYVRPRKHLTRLYRMTVAAACR